MSQVEASDAVAKLRAALSKAWEIILELREDFKAKTKYQQLRIMIAAVFLLDIVATVAFVVAMSGPSAEIEAWFQKSFPLDMLIVRNLAGEDLYDVHIVLDHRFKATISHLGESETIGLEIENRFLADDGFGPERGYVPKQLSVEFEGEKLDLPLRLER